MTEQDADESDITELNEAGNIHIAKRGFGLIYRGAFTGRDVDSERPTVHIHAPQSGEEDEAKGFAIVRIPDVDEATAILEDVRDDLTAADEATDVAVGVPLESRRCTVCREAVEERAICLVRGADDGEYLRTTEQLIDAMTDDESANFQDMERTVWVHITCLEKLTTVLQRTWNYSDDLLSDSI